MKKQQTLMYSAIGLVALFLGLVAVNYLAGKTPVRVDLTQGKLYTLSDGTRKMLQNLPTPVKLKLYMSQGENAMPIQLRGFAKRVDDIVKEFKSAAGDKLIVERYNPAPDSEEEDAAQLDGVEGQQLMTGEQFYLGLVASQLDRKQVIPALSPQREQLLEYDIARAIARVGIKERPTIGLMAGMPVLGARFNPYTRQAAEPWVLANELKRDFNVKEVSMTADSIDKDINVLLVIHPKDLPDFTEYALDQFVLRGGKLIVFVDPYAYFDQQPNPMMPSMPGQPTSSNLPNLFKAWGIEMDPGKVIADIQFASGGGQRYTPTVLSLNRSAFNRDDVVSSQVETLLYAFGGAFNVKPVEGLKVTDLVKSSPTSMLVDNIVATVSGDAATKGFTPANKSMPLAVRVTGKFKTAFPNGKPDNPLKAKDRKDAKADDDAPQIKEAAKDNSVIAVADVDMLNDGAAVEVQEIFGRRIVIPSNGNLVFAQSMVEQFSSGDALVSLASRASAFRPLTVVREMEAQAQQQYFGKIKALEDDLQKTNERIQALQKSGGGVAGAPKSALILTPEQQTELDAFKKRVAQTRIDLKEVRKELRQDAERMVFLTKVANIAIMPLLVTLVGLGVAMVRRRRQAAR